MTKEQVIARISGTDDYTFISSKMGQVCVNNLIETVLNTIPDADKVVIELEKILSGRQSTDITDDEIRFSSISIESKRKQDEANYIKYLLDKIEMLRSEIEARDYKTIERAVKIVEEYEIKKEPLCDLNAILLTIKERIKNI